MKNQGSDLFKIRKTKNTEVIRNSLSNLITNKNLSKSPNRRNATKSPGMLISSAYESQEETSQMLSMQGRGSQK
jgi:hypothetical protein